MGFLRVQISVGDPERRQWRELTADVNTSRPLSFLSASLLRGLGISPAMTGAVALPNGDRSTVELGYAWLAFDGREAMTHFVFADEDAHPTLGRIAINSLLLEFDSDSQQLVPMTNLTL